MNDCWKIKKVGLRSRLTFFYILKSPIRPISIVSGRTAGVGSELLIKRAQ